MVNAAVAVENRLLKVLKGVSNLVSILGQDSRTEAHNLTIDARNARKYILGTPFSDYVASRERQETDYVQLNMSSSGAASYLALAIDLALVKLHGRMRDGGIEAIVDAKIETNDQSEVGMHSYKVTLYGTGLKLKPDT